MSPVLPESEKKVQRSGSRTGGDGVGQGEGKGRARGLKRSAGARSHGPPGPGTV